MNIHETIFSLRRERGYTQERLADMLGVSIAAVSKWETCNAYPDITLLPKLAEIFDCSVVYLLGYNTQIKKTAADIVAEANTYYHAGNAEKALELLAHASKRYPANTHLMFELARHKLLATRGKGKNERELLESEAFTLFSAVAENDPVVARKSWAMNYLANLYCLRGDYEHAKTCCSQIGSNIPGLFPQLTQAAIIAQSDVSAKDNLKLLLDRTIYEFSQLFSWYATVLYRTQDSDAVISKCTWAIKILSEAATDSRFGAELSACYELLAWAYASQNAFDDAWCALETARDHAVAFDHYAANHDIPAYLVSAEFDVDLTQASAEDDMVAAITSAERAVYAPLRETARWSDLLLSLA